MIKDNVNHPQHYKWHPKVECKDVAMYFNWNLGNVIKYIWRHEHKDDPIEDLEKAYFLLYEEICRLKGERANVSELPEVTEDDLRVVDEYWDANVTKSENITEDNTSKSWQ